MTWLIAGLIWLLAMGGGLYYYLSPAWLTLLLLVFCGLAAVDLWRWRDMRAAGSALLLGAAGLSSLVNPVIIAVSFSRLLVLGAGLGGLALGRLVNMRQLLAGAGLAALWWPWVLLLATVGGWAENRNIVSAWSALFALLLFGQRSRAAVVSIVIQICLVVWLGSRGALLGLGAGLAVLVWPYIISKRPIMLSAPAALAVAVWARPLTAGYRLSYWQHAGAAFMGNAALGLGPGGLWANRIIPEPGTAGWQIHAHNAIVTGLAEGGLIWLATAGAVGLYWLWAYRWPRPVLAALTAAAVHSMVDEPLWWPGLLIFAGILAGSGEACAKTTNDL